ncbi:MAG: hypothetical protein MJB14_09490 [Spirochaetes bacterium]|nr:hypothetical protein [Spirochaetota bacterium]
MKYLFNLEEIEKSLFSVYKNFDQINSKLSIKREDMTECMVTNIVEAYRFLNQLLRSNIKIFSKAGLYSLLEFNHIVLCGANFKKKYEYHSHIMATRTKYQKNIVHLFKWYQNEENSLKGYKLASGFYFRQLSQPQLFIEGNHRTGNLLMNYILLSQNKLPFIIDQHTAHNYFELSGAIKFSDKLNMLDKYFKLPGLGKELSKFLKNNSSDKYIFQSEGHHDH